MARPKKFWEGGVPPKIITVSIRNSYLQKIPSQYSSLSEYIDDILSNTLSTTASAITADQQDSIDFFYSLFLELFQSGKVDDLIEKYPTLLEMSKIFAQLVKTEKK